ncbi:MAG: hypothetical protein PVS2B2_25110 [Candidatus Acidiferrum sp.]
MQHSPLAAQRLRYLLLAIFLFPGVSTARQKPASPGARILLLPRRVVAGDRATLAVLDVNGRLTPGVTVHFSNGEKYITDDTGRARFVAPLDPGVIFGSLPGRAGRVPVTILSATEASASELQVSAAPRVASVSDRFEVYGNGFCGDADSNQITIGGKAAIVLASSPVSLVVLAPLEIEAGTAVMKIFCGGKSAPGFEITLVNLELKAEASPLVAAEHRVLTVQVHGSPTPVVLEARNLAPEVASLSGGVSVRAVSSGGAENQVRFEVVGKQRGNFLISIRLVSLPVRPRR